MQRRAALLQWQFYQEVEAAKRDPALMEEMGDYLTVREVQVTLPKT